MSRKWKILLACVVAVTAACAAAWYLLPRPAVGGDYEAQYINVGETLENITGQIDQNTCNALNDLLRQTERSLPANSTTHSRFSRIFPAFH